MPKYSFCLPYYDPTYEKTEKITNLIKSIVRNSSTDDYEFVIVKDGNSYTESHNTAMLNAKGEYLIIFNDDIEVLDPEFVEKFTVEGLGAWKGSAHAWSIPRYIMDRVGVMDERFKDGFNCEDTDYFHRVKLAGFKIIDLDIDLKHNQNRIRYADTEINRKIFIEKWGFEP